MFMGMLELIPLPSISLSAGVIRRRNLLLSGGGGGGGVGGGVWGGGGGGGGGGRHPERRPVRLRLMDLDHYCLEQRR